MAKKQRTTLSLDPDAHAILTDTGNGSGYVERVLRQRRREWTDALMLLQGVGWTTQAVLAACWALNGYWLVGMGRVPGAIAGELHAAERETEIPSGEYGVDPARWKSLVTRLEETPEIAHALAVVVDEYWTENEALRRAVRRLSE